MPSLEFGIDDGLGLGYGLIDAGHTLNMVRKDKYRFWHLSSDTDPHIPYLNITTDTNHLVKIGRRFQDYDNNWYQRGMYRIDVIEKYDTIFHNVAYPDTIIHIWPRHSSAGMYDGIFIDPDNYDSIILHTKNRIISYDSSKAILLSYAFRLKDTLGNLLAVLPRPDYIDFTQFAYSMITTDRNTITRDSTPVYQSIIPLEDNIFISLSPNPLSDIQKISVNLPNAKYVQITLYDMMGNLVKNIYEGSMQSGNNDIIANLSSISSAIYVYHIKIDDKYYTIKTSKY